MAHTQDFSKFPYDLIPNTVLTLNLLKTKTASSTILPTKYTFTANPAAKVTTSIPPTTIADILKMHNSVRLTSIQVKISQDELTYATTSSAKLQTASSTFSEFSFAEVATAVKGEFDAEKLTSKKIEFSCDPNTRVCSEKEVSVARKPTLDEISRIKRDSISQALHEMSKALGTVKASSNPPRSSEMLSKSMEDFFTFSTYFDYRTLNATLVSNVQYTHLLPIVDLLTMNRSDYKWYRHMIKYQAVDMNPTTGARLAYLLPGGDDQIFVTVEIWPRGTFYDICVTTLKEKGSVRKLPSEFFASDDGRSNRWELEFRTEESYWPSLDALAALFQGRFDHATNKID